MVAQHSEVRGGTAGRIRKVMWFDSVSDYLRDWLDSTVEEGNCIDRAPGEALFTHEGRTFTTVDLRVCRLYLFQGMFLKRLTYGCSNVVKGLISR